MVLYERLVVGGLFEDNQFCYYKAKVEGVGSGLIIILVSWSIILILAGECLLRNRRHEIKTKIL